MAPKSRINCHINGFKLLLSGTYEKMVITGTPRQILYLTTVNQYLRIFSPKNLSVIGKISIGFYEKKHKAIENVEMSKIATVEPLFKEIIIYT